MDISNKKLITHSYGLLLFALIIFFVPKAIPLNLFISFLLVILTALLMWFAWTNFVYPYASSSYKSNKALIMAIPDALIVINDKNIIVNLNPAAELILGYSKSDLIGKEIQTVFPRIDRNCIGEDCEFNQERSLFGSGMILEDIAKKSDGYIVPVEINIGCTAGRDKQLVIMMRDITDRKLVEKDHDVNNQQLKKSNAELEAFASVAAHDLKDPLRKIEYFSSKLSNNGALILDQQAQKCLGRIETYVKTMTGLIDELLKYAKFCTESCTVKMLNLNELLNNVLLEFEDAMTDIGAKVEVSELPHVFGDQIKLEQLFRNLISNAIKYRSQERALEIKVFSDACGASETKQEKQNLIWHRLVIEDNGIGIMAENADKIFEPFARATKNSTSGVGLGLSVCKKIVEMHHGKISVSSQKNYKTKINIDIPIYDAEILTIKSAA